jgi:hypothetical protein
MQDASSEVVRRVRQVVERAAAAQIETGGAQVTVGRLADFFPDGDYDCPVVVLDPANPDAASVVVELQGDELWWLNTGDGPGTEFYAGMKEDRYELLGRLVRAVVAGDYRHGPCVDEQRRLLRSPRQVHGWFETFDTDQGPQTSRHFGREVPRQERRFAPY